LKYLNRKSNKKYPLWLNVLALIVLVVVFYWGNLSEEKTEHKRLAFVVGNGQYTQDFLLLDNPENDARAMHKRLTALGFESQLVLNTDKQGFNSSLSDFIQKARKYERLGSKVVTLFYYAGHGIQFDHVNYLVPVDSELMTSESISANSLQKGFISLKHMTDKIATLEAALNLVILDACRDLPIEELQGQIGGWADIVQQNFFVAFGTAPGEKAQDGTGENHGVFTQAILNQMNIPGLSLPQFFQEVRKEVMLKTNYAQIPQESNQSTLDLVLNKQAQFQGQHTTFIAGLVVLLIWWGLGQLLTQRQDIQKVSSQGASRTNRRFMVQDIKYNRVVGHISKDRVNMGRGLSNDICLHDEQQQISRMHCQIIKDTQSDNFWLQETQSSTNGTYLQLFGKMKKLKVGKKYPLQIGQVFYLVAEKGDLGARPFNVVEDNGEGA